MDKWILFKNAVNDLLVSNYSKSQVKKKWQLIANDFKNYRPNHLLNLLYLLDNSHLKLKSRILDHGCGGGITLFFLASKGYYNILGIDINSTQDYINRKNACNKIFKIILNTNTNVIQHYNGKKINYKNNFFDYIYSQQVIEHVQSHLLDSYIAEERRILKSNGMVLHQIPHRLGPFEGHTKKWFIHWLPKKWYYYLLKDDKQNLNLVKNALFLRWPWQLKSIFNKYFNNVNNLVNLRLKYDIVSEEYSKKEKIIRKILVLLFKVPLLGFIFLRLFSVFFQLELLAKK
ncbi:MAG: hypothetical protein CBB97_02065 [Candidatus Endolissoclinum sp. TMED37]|nr:MAG: hypothetical protein CBB97_02065 [Candidatus Endolissoclinum sp. TMED37]|tara:strand:- start:1679 stop:2542 length:864 start_codon:yes stop_codon:yes gene_type:complete